MAYTERLPTRFNSTPLEIATVARCCYEAAFSPIYNGMLRDYATTRLRSISPPRLGFPMKNTNTVKLHITSALSVLIALIALVPACRTYPVLCEEDDCDDGSTSTSSSTDTNSTSTNTSTSTSTSTSTGPTSNTNTNTNTGGPSCGDGTLDEGEDCDDGNTVDGDTCPADCQSKCGDGVMHGDEACDNGEDNGVGKPCSDDCTLNTCGNGMPDDGEECDKGQDNGPGMACSELCTSNCGNGMQDEGEACDNSGMGGNGPGTPCLEDCTPNPCGNGILELDKGEECDDGNYDADDGCSPMCIEERFLVFVSSATFQGDLGPKIDKLTGLKLADAQCQALAANADKLPGTFKAWLSDSTGSPATRFGLENFTGAFELADADASVVALGWADLTDGELLHAIDVDESGVSLVEQSVWSNTLADGTQKVENPEYDCNKWSSNSDTEFFGRPGDTQSTDSTWTDFDAQFPTPCNIELHLYCFQVSTANP
ncbi:MAG TPA: DUF4215 domain-containing protein [Nannocystis exedens]|nr:DUF4215 domain-containing protein [Nannocystis exedens]